jgi:hypothetical protein
MKEKLTSLLGAATLSVLAGCAHTGTSGSYQSSRVCIDESSIAGKLYSPIGLKNVMENDPNPIPILEGRDSGQIYTAKINLTEGEVIEVMYADPNGNGPDNLDHVTLTNTNLLHSEVVQVSLWDFGLDGKVDHFLYKNLTTGRHQSITVDEKDNVTFGAFMRILAHPKTWENYEKKGE